MDQRHPPEETDPSIKKGMRVRARRGWVWVAVYVLALVASHGTQLVVYHPASRETPSGFDPDLGATRRYITLPAMDESGAIASETMRVSFLEWSPPSGAVRLGDVVLLHGSPGSGSNFSRLGPLLSAAGYHVIAPDLPGFGESDAWVPRYSILAHAHATLALMDAMGVKHAHVVGWSMGSGVALHMADLRPDSLDSVTLLAGIGTQETEGSGSYAFERVKYAVQYAGLVVLPEVVPHFGLLGPRQTRHALSRNFLDSDQRPLEEIMRSLTLPVLVMHGRDDFLVADWAAEHHHEIIPTSTLVMLDASHFLPFFQPKETAEYLTWYFGMIRVGESPVGEIVQTPAESPLGDAGLAIERAIVAMPWWMLALAIAGLTVWRADAAAVATGAACALFSLDLGVGVVGLTCGLLLETAVLHAAGLLQAGRVARSGARTFDGMSLADWRRRWGDSPAATMFSTRLQPWRRAEAALAGGVLRRVSMSAMLVAPLAALVWAVPAGALAWATVAAMKPLANEYGAVWLIPSILVALVGVRGYTLALTWTGRRRLVMHLRRLTSFEFWPACVVYVPVIAASVWHAVRLRGTMLPTCCNPGISGHGGIIGESKSEILRSLDHARDATLHARFIQADDSPSSRAGAALDLIASDRELGGFPVILKPDGGFRGHALKLARSAEDVRRYFETMHDAAIVQRYHPGPHECGILWARHPDGPREGRAGFIYAITMKEFPTIVGNGTDTLETLIYRHPRYRLQADVFLARFAESASAVPRHGERIALALAGNHCQGTLFRDGAHLITPALEDAIDRIASGYPYPEGGGLDIGRFDVRYDSPGRLAAGEGFAIVELNGSTGEPTNIYDPGRSMLWAYGVLLGHVRLLHDLGAKRRDEGARPARLREVIAATRAFYRARTGSAMSD